MKWHTEWVLSLLNLTRKDHKDNVIQVDFLVSYMLVGIVMTHLAFHPTGSLMHPLFLLGPNLEKDQIEMDYHTIKKLSIWSTILLKKIKKMIERL